MTIEIRPGTPETHRAMSNAIATALLFPAHDDEAWERAAPTWLDVPSYGAWDGDRCVGSASHFLVDTTVPGGVRLPTGAVSRVGVLPTHRRRGAASGLLRRLVDDAVERGLALMSLRASEATIYERFGFGMAGEYTTATIDPARARPIHAAGRGSIRLVDRDAVLDTVRPIYDRCRHRRAGMVSRPDSWWRRYFADAIKLGTTSNVIVLERDGEAVGYAHYDLAWNDGPGMSGGRGTAHDVIALDHDAELALWSYLLDIDLVRTWKAEERPVDDILPWAVTDRRAYVVTAVEDEQWLRLVDVDRALRSRTYGSGADSIVIEVGDPWVEANRGVWHVDAGGATRVDDARPHVRVGIAALSAAYLGGTPWWSLAATGRVEVLDPSAIPAADGLFASRPLPWCGSFF